ncbi:hypothetical protein GQ43DRAFT_112638 [Delitschia confertaspora ATCC 74209]|uniref:Uncharacterized protein n=1 Tax=Delitschia confertaspora ATCC 74209 TaxID=1513339 RepID=A0A9P4JHL2_9PLEO|nr:hypothetical protein GQ43DRAFT_112638 [Delitschia confertaspora ATCC 74209]
MFSDFYWACIATEVLFVILAGGHELVHHPVVFRHEEMKRKLVRSFVALGVRRSRICIPFQNICTLLLQGSRPKHVGIIQPAVEMQRP